MSAEPLPTSANPAIRDRLLHLVGQILGKPDAASSVPPEARLSELGMENAPIKVTLRKITSAVVELE